MQRFSGSVQKRFSHPVALHSRTDEARQRDCRELTIGYLLAFAVARHRQTIRLEGQNDLLAPANIGQNRIEALKGGRESPAFRAAVSLKAIVPLLHDFLH